MLWAMFIVGLMAVIVPLADDKDFSLFPGTVLMIAAACLKFYP